MELNKMTVVAKIQKEGEKEEVKNYNGFKEAKRDAETKLGRDGVMSILFEFEDGTFLKEMHL